MSSAPSDPSSAPLTTTMSAGTATGTGPGTGGTTTTLLTDDLLPLLILDYLAHNGHAESARAFVLTRRSGKGNERGSDAAAIPSGSLNGAGTSFEASCEVGNGSSGGFNGTRAEQGEEDEGGDVLMASSVMDFSATPRASEAFGTAAGVDRLSGHTRPDGMDVDDEEDADSGMRRGTIDKDEENKRVEGMLIRSASATSPSSSPADGLGFLSSSGGGQLHRNGKGKGRWASAEFLAGADAGRSSSGKYEDVERMVREIEVRRLIRHHICNGDISSAFRAIRAHFPEVLDEAHPGPNRKQNEHGGEHGSLATDLSVSKDHHLAPPPKVAKQFAGKALSHPIYNIDSYPAASSSTPFPYQDVYDRPTYLSLNLEIQSLVDGVRTMVVPNSPSSSMASSFHSDAGGQGIGIGIGGGVPPMTGLTGQAIAIKGVTNGVGGPLNGNRPTNGHGHGSEGSSGNGTGASSIDPIALVVGKAKALYERLKMLTPAEQAVYGRAVDDVAGLLAYVDMEDSPLCGYLEQSRRDALADQVDGSIMVSLGRNPKPLLDTMVRHISLLWSKMREGDVSSVPDFTEAEHGFAAAELGKRIKYGGQFDIQALIAEGH